VTATEHDTGFAPETSSTLDDAYERLESTGFELPNGFVNHAPMACEALAALGLLEEVDAWSRRYAMTTGARVNPVDDDSFEWEEALGDYRRLPEWIAYFSKRIDERGWQEVVSSSVPRLLPSLSTALFHGAIRAGHAVRAIAATDTAPRRSELSRSLAFWAARYRPGQEIGPTVEITDARRQITMAAAAGARHYLASPNILHLHGVTGAMAVELFVGHIGDDAVGLGLAQIAAEHAALYRGTTPVGRVEEGAGVESSVFEIAAASGDPHQVKLVEACRRGFDTTGDPSFVAAAKTVVGAR